MSININLNNKVNSVYKGVSDKTSRTLTPSTAMTKKSATTTAGYFSTVGGINMELKLTTHLHTTVHSDDFIDLIDFTADRVVGG